MKSGKSLKNIGILSEDAFLSSENGSGLEQTSVENGVEQEGIGNGFEDIGDFEMGKGNLADEVLVDLEEYFEDISDRLMISRMVSDSVIKGMVTAMEQEAAERITIKEQEVTNLRECIRSRDVNFTTFEVIREPMVQSVYEDRHFGRFSSFMDGSMKHDKMIEALHGVRNVAREQFNQIEKEIDCIRGSNLITNIGSNAKLAWLAETFQENESKNLQNINQMLDYLKITVDTVCKQVDDIFHSSLCEWQQEKDLLGKVEDIVIKCVIKSLHEESQEKLWDQHAQFYGNQTAKWLEKFNEIVGLRTQLDAIVKSLSITETGLVSHGSHDLDHLHRKALSNHFALPTSLCDGNGKIEESKICDIYDFYQLKHLSKEEMVKYFNDIITKIRRDHDSAIQQKTEEYFSLKRNYLNEKGSYVIHRKDEEFDVLRKKIPEVITKLDDFFLENEAFPAMINNAESVLKLKGRLECLLSENCQLRDSLADKKHKIKCLEVQVADAAAKLLQHSLAEASVQKLVANLNLSVEDLCIEASLTEEVHKCAMKELIRHMRCNSEDSNMEFAIMREIYESIICEASLPPENTSICQIDDSDFESLIFQGLRGLIFKEVIKDAGEKINDLYQEFLSENEIRNALQIKVIQGENAVKLNVEEKEKLQEHILTLNKDLEQKEKLFMELSILQSKEREQFEQIFQELNSLREHANQQQMLVSASSNAKIQLIEAMEQIELHKVEMHNLIQKLDQTNDEFTEAVEKRNAAIALAQERHDQLLLREASEEGLRKEMETTIFIVKELSKKINDFESRISGMITKNNLRLENVNSLKSLIKMATEFKRTGLTYRYRLERTCSDLQKAEAEVDLLGDEVDTLLRLLEKIYIALDHYSPILKHYPGIIDVLELVRRELSAESIKLL